MQLSTALALLSAPLVISALPTIPPSTESSHPKIPIAPYTVPIVHKIPRVASKENALSRLLSVSDQPDVDFGVSDDVVIVRATLGGSEYTVPITIGNQEFEVILDTGSANTWVPSVNITCEALNGQPRSQADCGFGPLYDPSESDTYEAFGFDANFNIAYRGGDFLTGTPAYETITIGNLSVPHQVFAIVTDATFSGGDNITSGLLGLAGPYLSAVFNGTDPANDSSRINEYVYDPFFNSAVADNLTEPYFSVALERPNSTQERSSEPLGPLGYLSFGGLPPQVQVTNNSVTVPNLPYRLNISGANITDVLYYTIAVDEITFPGSDKIVGGTASNRTILDTGTTLVYLRSDVAAGINAAFAPPATLDPARGLYEVACNATTPPVGLTIGGSQFFFQPSDLVFYDAATGGCISGIQAGGRSPTSIFVLGDRFLVNVVATFDIQRDEITLSERLYVL